MSLRFVPRTRLAYVALLATLAIGGLGLRAAMQSRSSRSSSCSDQPSAML